MWWSSETLGTSLQCLESSPEGGKLDAAGLARSFDHFPRVDGWGVAEHVFRAGKLGREWCKVKFLGPQFLQT
jgi:hypothetical protein